MDDKLLKEALGNQTRDFKEEPLTQEEIQAVISHCEKECQRMDINSEVRDVYTWSIRFLREHLVH